MSIEPQQIRNIIEAALFAADHPLSIDALVKLFDEEQAPAREEIRAALEVLAEEYAKRGIELKEVSSGYRFQVQQNFAPWVSRLWEERPPRYSRALLETLALVAYRQPITRAEIEDIRGVSVSSHIVKTLQERNWVKVVGHRDVPGKPAMYATTREFLDYFNMKSLEELPTLAEIRDLDQINAELELKEAGDQEGVQQETLTQADQEAVAEETAENLELSFGEEAPANVAEPVEKDTLDTLSNEAAPLESENSADEISSGEDESQTVSGAYIIGEPVNSGLVSSIQLQEKAEDINTTTEDDAVNANLEHDVDEELAEDFTPDQAQDERFSQSNATDESDDSNGMVAQHDLPFTPAEQDNSDEDTSLIESQYESDEPANDDQSDTKGEQEQGEIKKFSSVDSDHPAVEQDSRADRMSSEKSAFN